MLDGLSLPGSEIMTMARSCHRNGTPSCHASSTMGCHGIGEITLRSYLRDDANCVGLIARDESVIDSIKDEFQAVGNTQLIKYVRQVMLGSILTDT